MGTIVRVPWCRGARATISAPQRHRSLSGMGQRHTPTHHRCAYHRCVAGRLGCAALQPSPTTQIRSEPYSPNVLEGEFCEIRLIRVLMRYCASNGLTLCEDGP